MCGSGRGGEALTGAIADGGESGRFRGDDVGELASRSQGDLETGFLEDIWNAPIEEVYAYTSSPSVDKAPDTAIITFDKGVPVAIDGETVTAYEAVHALNQRAGAHGVAGSTWSRTAWSASRAARCTRRRARSR